MFHAEVFLLLLKDLSPVARNLYADMRFSSASVTEGLCSSPQSRAEAAIFEFADIVMGGCPKGFVGGKYVWRHHA